MTTIILSVVCVLGAALNVFLGIRVYKQAEMLEKIRRARPNIDEMVAVMMDLNRLAGGIIEIRRIDPSSVFTRTAP